MSRGRAPLASLALFAVVASCRNLPEAPAGAPRTPFDWTIGEWRGVRRDGASAEPLAVRVEPILGGAGQLEHLEVTPADGRVYRGFTVQVLDPASRKWERRYVNSTNGEFVPLEGAVDGERSVWRVTAPERTRESRLVSEKFAPDGWRRTMSVSEDGGASWRVLWSDELRRTEAAPR